VSSLVAGPKSKTKSSVQRSLRTSLLQTYPLLEPYIDTILPKKSQLDAIKLPDRVTLYSLDNLPLFYQHMDDPLIPHLKVVHQYPQCFKSIQIDRGAIRFVLSGATLMVPGLTSKGGKLPDKDDQLQKGDIAIVTAEGKEEACMIGSLEVGTEEMKAKGKGPAIEKGHYIGDGLWKLDLN
jgi:malignant T-cell-amplified sequence